MANPEHLAILIQGVEVWNQWRDENPEVRPNLFGADLLEADLVGADLVGADLSSAVLCSADLNNANLSSAVLYSADLNNSNLRNANLRNAELYNANLSIVDLSNADLSGADLLGTDLVGTNLSGADLSGANLSYANLSGTNLSGADLSGADLSDADLRGADLRGADFKGCKLGATTFGGNDLSICQGLDSILGTAPCSIDFSTLQTTANLPKSFLQKIGFPDLLIDYLPDFYTPSLRLFPVFLSHSWANKAFAKKLYDALIKKGVQVWFDEKKMKPGDEIFDSLSKGIAHYDKMVLVCSKESLSESWWVDREIDRILKKERELFKERKEKIPLLIPITIDDHVRQWDGAKGEEVRRYNIGNFKAWQDERQFETALNELIHALHVDRPDVRPPSYL